MLFGTNCSIILTKGEFGIQLSSNPSQKMLSYLIAVEIEKIIQNNNDPKKENFVIEVLLENMNEIQSPVDKRKSNDKYKYCIRLKDNEIKLAFLTKY